VNPVGAASRLDVIGDVTQEVPRVTEQVADEVAVRPAPAAGSPRTSSWGGRIAWMLAAVSLLAIWALLFAFVLSGLQEQRDQRELYASFRGQLVGSGPVSAPLGGAIAPNAPVALLSASRGILDNAVVVEGTTSSNLEHGPGHLRTSPLPGQAGTAIVYGRSVTYGAPFKNITDLHRGDVITATTGQGTFRYLVERIRHAGDTVVSLPPGAGRLTLVSSTGPGWRAGVAPTTTVYLDAALEGVAQPTPPGHRTTYSWSELPMHGQLGALLPLVLILLLLAATVIALVLARVWWGGRQAWIIGVPVILALLWLSTQTASALLPNLF